MGRQRYLMQCETRSRDKDELQLVLQIIGA